MSGHSGSEQWWGHARWPHCPSRNFTTAKVTHLRSVDYCEVLSELQQGAPRRCWWSGRRAQVQSPCSPGRICPPHAQPWLGSWMQSSSSRKECHGDSQVLMRSSRVEPLYCLVLFLKDGTGNRMNEFLGKSSVASCGNFTSVNTVNKVAWPFGRGTAHLKGCDLESA